MDCKVYIRTELPCLFFFSRNISWSFCWRLCKSKSFISHQHTSSKTTGWILVFLSNHFRSIFWCHDPSQLTSVGSIWAAYPTVFPVFLHDTWLITALFSVFVKWGDSSSDTWHLIQTSRSKLFISNRFFSVFIEDFVLAQAQLFLKDERAFSLNKCCLDCGK